MTDTPSDGDGVLREFRRMQIEMIEALHERFRLEREARRRSRRIFFVVCMALPWVAMWVPASITLWAGDHEMEMGDAIFLTAVPVMFDGLVLLVRRAWGIDIDDA